MAGPVSANPYPEGFGIPYGREKGNFRVYLMAFLAAVLFIAFFASLNPVLLALAIAAGATAYYFFPLLENRPRLGANQYGIFVDGFGIIAWRAIEDIRLQTQAIRSIEVVELQIKLSQPVASALVTDWRQLPLYRLLMKLPWKMSHENVVRIKMEPFETSPEEVLNQLTRMRRFFT